MSYEYVYDQKKISRRKFFKSLGYVGLRTAAMSGINVASAMIAEKGYIQNYKNRQEELKKERESGILNIKHFAEDICKTSEQLLPSDENILPKLLMSYIFGDVIAQLILKTYLPFHYRRIGSASGVLAKGIDIGSTYRGIDPTEDPRFKEYGFDVYFMESNIFLPQIPSTIDLLIHALIFIPFTGIGGWAIPPLFTGYLAMTPSIYNSNVHTGLVIQKMLDVGDEIKGMLNQGKSEEEIRKYLRDLASKN